MHIVDTTMFYANASGGVRTYLEAKQQRMAGLADVRHSVVVPGPLALGAREQRPERPPAPPLPFSKGYRFPLRPGPWAEALVALRPDVIEFGDPYVPAWAAVSAGRRLGVPVVGFYHSDLPALAASRLGSWTGPFVRTYIRRLYSQCDLVLAPSRTVAAQLLQMGLEQVEHQHLGVDLERFHPAHADPTLRRRLGIPAAARLLVFAGRGSREKHLPVLLDAMRLLGRGYHLLLVGVGPQPHLPDNVTVIESFQPVDRLAAIMAACDALLHGGDQETFGLVVVEAMACGLPVVGINAGAVAELVPASCGELAPSCSPGALAQAVRQLFRRDVVALGQRARAHAEMHFSWDTVVAQLVSRYRRLCERPWPAMAEQETYGGI